MAEPGRLAKNRFMSIRPPPRQPKQTWLWLAPYAAIGTFALAMLIVTGLLQWREQDTALSALELYAEAFEQAGALGRLEGFASHFGADF